MHSTIDIRELGRGEPIVLLHGFGTPRDAFDGLAHAIAAERRVLLPAMRGYEPSAPVAHDATLTDAVRELENALLARGVTTAALVGYSLGGYRALAIAVGGRIRATGLLLLGGFAHLDDQERAAYRQMTPLAAEGALPKGIASQRLLSPTFAAAHPGDGAHVDAWFEAIAHETLAYEARTLAGCEDLRSRLASIAAPIIAHAGTADVSIPPSRADEIARLVPHGRAVSVEGAGHLLMLEDVEGTRAAAMSLPTR
jgi:3-oxoadipate enol-lactonase